MNDPKLESRIDKKKLIYTHGNWQLNDPTPPKSIMELKRYNGVSYSFAYNAVHCKGNIARKKRIRKPTKVHREVQAFIKKLAVNRNVAVNPECSLVGITNQVNKRFSNPKKIFKISTTSTFNYLKKLVGPCQKVKVNNGEARQITKLTRKNS